MNNTTRHPDPPFDLPIREYYQLVHSLTTRLPPPLADTPQALRIRNQAALDQVAALKPVNANEVALATQCVATRAQAEDVLRSLREQEGDIKVVMKLNAQYVAMVRASLGAHGHLLRAQAVRHKREANPAALNADEWTQHVVASSMQQVLDMGPLPVAPAAEPSAPPQAAEDHPPPAPEPALVAPCPPPALAVELSPAPAAQPLLPPVPAMVSAAPPPPVPPAAPALPRPHRPRTAAQAQEPLRDLAAEADYYARVYPYRARPIRQHRGLPPDCTFGPPDDDLVCAIVTGTSQALRDLDGPSPTAA
jgi:hypothetical protein